MNALRHNPSLTPPEDRLADQANDYAYDKLGEAPAWLSDELDRLYPGWENAVQEAIAAKHYARLCRERAEAKAESMEPTP